MNVLDNLIESINLLDEIEQEYNNSPTKQSEIDSKLSDIYHYIEDNSLNTNQRYRIINLLKELRLERREIKNNYELLLTFKNNEKKLCQTDSRKMLIAEVRKRKTSLGRKYKNRIYTEEEIKELVGE